MGEWVEWADAVRGVASKTFGMASGKRKTGIETWWWNEEIQDWVKRKKLAKKEWDKKCDEQSKRKYKEICKETKRRVTNAKNEAYKELYQELDTKEGEKEVYRIVKQRDRASKDIQHIRIIKDKDGKCLSKEEDILKRWKEYFEHLMNEENRQEERTEIAAENE